MSVDLASVSAHKIYGRRASARSYVRSRQPRVRLQPLCFRRRPRAGNALGDAETSRASSAWRPRRGARRREMPRGGSAAAAARAPPRRRSRAPRRRRAERPRSPAIEADGASRRRTEQPAARNLNVSFAGVEGEALLVAHQGRRGLLRVRVHVGVARAVARADGDRRCPTSSRTRPIRFGLGAGRRRGDGRTRPEARSVVALREAAVSRARAIIWHRLRALRHAEHLGFFRCRRATDQLVLRDLARGLLVTRTSRRGREGEGPSRRLRAGSARCPAICCAALAEDLARRSSVVGAARRTSRS
jgi:hypothetical protein